MKLNLVGWSGIALIIVFLCLAAVRQIGWDVFSVIFMTALGFAMGYLLRYAETADSVILERKKDGSAEVRDEDA